MQFWHFLTFERKVQVVFCSFSTTHCPAVSFVHVYLCRPRTLLTNDLAELFSCEAHQSVTSRSKQLLKWSFSYPPNYRRWNTEQCVLFVWELTSNVAFTECKIHLISKGSLTVSELPLAAVACTVKQIKLQDVLSSLNFSTHVCILIFLLLTTVSEHAASVAKSA